MKKICVFDFDGTLFRSPENTEKNRSLYEKYTGIPWIIDKQLSQELQVGMRSGWFGRPETLEPPLVPNPAPPEMFIEKVCEKFRESRNDDNCYTVIVTGRHKKLRSQVVRILGDGALLPVIRNRDNTYENRAKSINILMLGDNGPAKIKVEKPTTTLEWKLWIMESLFQYYSASQTMEIWEDREEHAERFRQLNTEWKDRHVIVNQVFD